MALHKHEMERKVLESEEKFRSVIQHSSDGIVLTDNQGNVIEWNLAAEQISGLKRSSVIGQPLQDVIFRMLPEDQRTTVVQESLAAQWNTSQDIAYIRDPDQLTEMEIESPLGIRRVVQSNVFSIKTSQGTLAGAIMRDITENKVAEAALKENEIIFSSFLDQSQVYVFFKDKNIRSLRLSKNYEQMLGMSISNLLGKTMNDLFPSELAKSMVADDVRILNGGQRVTVEEEFNGRIYETVKFPIVKDGKPDMLAGITVDITERKQAEEALRRSERDLREAQAVAHVGNWKWDVKKGEVTWSDEMYRIFGIDKNSYTGRLGDAIAHVIHPDDLHLVLPSNAEAFAEQKPVEYRIILPDKSIHYIWAKAGDVVFDTGGNPVFMTGIAQDITERRQAEEAVKSSEKRFRALIENGRDHISLLAADGSLLWESPSISHTLGYERDRFLGHNIFELMHPDDHEWTRNLFMQVVQKPGSSQEGIFRLLRSDGSWRWIEATATNLLHELVVQAVVINYRDITERRQVDSDLRKLSQAVEQSANAVVITNTEGHIEYANPKFVEVSGYPLSEVLGKTPRILNSGKHSLEFYAELWQTIKAGQVWKGEIRNRRKDGTLYWEDSTITPIFDSSHRLINFIAVKEDITARKALEEAERDHRQWAEALCNTSAALSSTLNLDEVLDRVLENIEMVTTFDAAMVLMVEEHSVRQIRHHNKLRKALDQGVTGNMQANLMNIPLLQQMRETHQPCLIPDTQADPRWRAIPGMDWIHSFISAPIIIREQVAGILNILSATPGFFAPSHAERLSVFAGQVAVAMENAQLFEEAYYLSVTDSLTETMNRRYFFEVARLELERTRRYCRVLSVMMIDVDHFKGINDVHGHAVGDFALREIANRIQRSVRTVDIVARYGGEEFIVLMPETTLHDACQVAERIRKNISEKSIADDSVDVVVTLSIGVAEMDEKSSDMDKLIRYADQALYAAKAAGRNQVECYRHA
jgi:diguanylate cyclase (GGDEF)-like protein/PAS domain S-box-containing protein